MNEREQKALEGAAFLAWVTLGEYLSVRVREDVDEREEMQIAYDALTKVLPGVRKGTP